MSINYGITHVPHSEIYWDLYDADYSAVVLWGKKKCLPDIFSTYWSKGWGKSMMSFFNNFCLQLALKNSVLRYRPTTKYHRHATIQYNGKDSAYKN